MAEYLPVIGIGLGLGFGLAALAGLFILPLLRKFHTGQQVRDDGPQTHLKKSGTPTFGGAIFLLAFTILTIANLIYRFDPMVLTFLLFTLCHAGIGFYDDYVKIRVNKEGISAKQKTILLLIVEAFFILLLLYVFPRPVHLLLPFGWGNPEIRGIGKIFYAFFLLIYFYACTNAVNITDGVDGLASTVTIVVLTFTGLTAAISATAMSQSLVWLSFTLAGSLLGFLIYNWHKAKVFMGDFGSLALGAALSAIFLMEEIPLAFLLAGIVYVVEILSVFIQVQYFRHTGGKRIFRMSPIHHHYELGGWSEVKVVIVFALVALLGCVLAGLSFWPWLR